MQRQDKKNNENTLLTNKSTLQVFLKSKFSTFILKVVLTLLFVFTLYLWIKNAPENVNTYIIKKLEDLPYRFIVPIYDKHYETNALKVKVDTHTMNFIAEDKRSRYIWRTSLENEDEELNEAWKMFFNSAVTIEFYDNTGSIRKAFSTRDAKIDLISNEDNKLKFYVNFQNIGISFSFSIAIFEDFVEVHVNNIKERDYYLMSMFIYPYLGASRGLVEGRFLLADGVGAIIDLSKSTFTNSPFKMRMYGEDFGLTEVVAQNYFKNIKETEKYLLPIYGLLYGKNGLLTIIKKDEEYSEIQAYKSGIVTPYNWISSKFIFRDTHKKLLNKRGQGIIIPQEKINTLSPILQYHFLNNANEFTIAKKFVEQEQKAVEKKYQEAEHPLFKFNILMVEGKKTTFGYSIVTMTTQKNLKVIKEELSKIIPGSVYVLRGFSKGGYSRNSPIHLPFEEKVINPNELEENDYLYLDYLKLSEESKHFKKVIVAQNRLEQLMEFNRYYFVRPKLALDLAKKELEKFKKSSIKNFAIGSLGNILFSTKWEERKKVKEIFQEIARLNKKSIIYGANWYIAKVTDNSSMISDIPIEFSGFEIEDDIFPLVPYILNNFRTIFSRPINLTSDYELNTLKCIEYGVMPSFYLTWESSKELIDTYSQELISTRFEDWKENIKDSYKKYESVYRILKNARPISREKIYNNVYLLEYDNGAVIIFNYNNYPIRYEGLEVKERTFGIIKYPK